MYEKVKRSLKPNSEVPDPQSNISNTRKQHRVTWIRRLSPIIALSTLGVASSSFGFYTAQNQASIAGISSIVPKSRWRPPSVPKPPLPPSVLKPKPTEVGIALQKLVENSSIVIKNGKVFQAVAMPNLELRVYSKPFHQYAEGNLEYLILKPKLKLKVQLDPKTKWLRIIGCDQPELCKNAINKYVHPQLLVCEDAYIYICGATPTVMKDPVFSEILVNQAKETSDWLDTITQYVGW